MNSPKAVKMEQMDHEERVQDDQDADATLRQAEEALAQYRGTPRRHPADC